MVYAPKSAVAFGLRFIKELIGRGFVWKIFVVIVITGDVGGLVATVRFSHPVDAAQFEQRISIALSKDGQYLGLQPDRRNYSVAYDKFRLAAYIHSAALAMPRDDTAMTLRIDRGVRAARGGNETSVGYRPKSSSPAAPACASRGCRNRHHPCVRPHLL